MRILLNAIPLTRVSTGIGRYMRSVYAEIERMDGVEVGYFDGVRIRTRMPAGPTGSNRDGLLARLFWRLPPRMALVVREVLHARAVRAFARIKGDWDIYHEASFFPFAAPPGARTVFTVHDLSMDRHPDWHPRERVLFHRRHIRESLAGVHRYLAVSEFTRREMEDVWGIAPEVVTVTPLAHDPARFKPQAKEAVRLVRKRLGLPERYFLVVGSGDPRKNLALVLEAVSHTHHDVPLVVAGWSGWDGAGHADGRVVCLGYVDDMDLPAVYAGSVALIYPSLYEGFGLPVVEAMACGCPVVATVEASLPEACGGAALPVHDPHDSGELAQILGRLAEDVSLCEQLRDRGLQRVSALSWRLTAQATIDTFRRVLSADA